MRAFHLQKHVIMSSILLIVWFSAAYTAATVMAHPSQLPPRPIITPAPSAQSDAAATVCLRLASAPTSTVRPAETATYHLVAHNTGRGSAQAVHLAFSYPPDAQDLVDVQFTSPHAWVTDVQVGMVKMDLGRLGHDETVTATVQLHSNARAPLGTALAARASVTWLDDDRGGSGMSNRLSLRVEDSNASTPTRPLNITPTTGTSTALFAIGYEDFASNERVSVWYHASDGSSVALGAFSADAQGRFESAIQAAALVPGEYTVTAYGNCSQIAAVAVFTVTGN